jgi:hypothetical protein
MKTVHIVTLTDPGLPVAATLLWMNTTEGTLFLVVTVPVATFVNDPLYQCGGNITATVMGAAPRHALGSKIIRPLVVLMRIRMAHLHHPVMTTRTLPQGLMEDRDPRRVVSTLLTSALATGSALCTACSLCSLYCLHGGYPQC